MKLSLDAHAMQTLEAANEVYFPAATIQTSSRLLIQKGVLLEGAKKKTVVYVCLEKK